MQSIHIRSIFQLFLPISCPAGVVASTIVDQNHFGFRLNTKVSHVSYEYSIQLFDSEELKIQPASAFSFAKRKIHFFQVNPETNAIEGINLRLKINHGYFDFRRSNTTEIRLDVSCFNNSGGFIQHGSSPIIKLLPKRRKATDHKEYDNAIISIIWQDHSSESSQSNNHSIASPLDPILSSENDGSPSNHNNSHNYDNNSSSQEFYGSNIDAVISNSLESPPEVQMYHEDLAYPHEYNTNASIQLFANPQNVPLRNPDEQYMTLYNGNAEVIGNFRALNFYKASDLRIKQEIRRLIEDYDCRDVLLQIDGVAYKFRPGVSNATNKRFVGFIAQQVESVVPEAVQLIDGILHVDYESLIPYLNESIKQNYRDLNNIRTENEQLRKSLDVLYFEFVKREAIVKYQDNSRGASMFSHLAMFKPRDEHSTKPTPLWQWALFAIAALALFIGGGVTVYYLTNSPADSNIPVFPIPSPTGGPPIPKIFNRDTDRQALIDFYMATKGDHWKTNYGWLTAIDVCSWTGVACDPTRRVAMVSLSSFGLDGTIPNSLGDLDHLNTLILTDNRLIGTIPASLFSLPFIRSLKLSGNSMLSGTIPANIAPPTTLNEMYIADCNITGTIPNWITGTILRFLQLQNNRMTGTIPVLPQLQNGNFQSNLFEGSVPRVLGSVGSIYLSNNRLTGTLDNWKIVSSNNILLANNSLTGELSFSDDAFHQITTLDISNNLFTSVRAEVRPPRDLQSCDVSNNRFKCPLPQWMTDKCNGHCT